MTTVNHKLSLEIYSMVNSPIDGEISRRKVFAWKEFDVGLTGGMVPGSGTVWHTHEGNRQ